YDVHFDLGHFVQAQHAVAVEVVLLHMAILQGDGDIAHRTQAEADPALHLGRDDIRIDGRTAIHRADHAIDGYVTVVIHAHFGNLGDQRLDRSRDGDPAPLALGQGRAGPAGLLGGE